MSGSPQPNLAAVGGLREVARKAQAVHTARNRVVRECQFYTPIAECCTMVRYL